MKRGRGRPRKYSVEERPSRPKLPPLIDENGNVVKRKRGRPRKHPLPDESKPKRGRGRPRKADNASLAVNSMSTIEEVQTNNNQDPHSHGRDLAGVADAEAEVETDANAHEESLNINLNLMDLYGSN